MRNALSTKPLAGTHFTQVPRLVKVPPRNLYISHDVPIIGSLRAFDPVVDKTNE